MNYMNVPFYISLSCYILLLIINEGIELCLTRDDIHIVVSSYTSINVFESHVILRRINTKLLSSGTLGAHVKESVSEYQLCLMKQDYPSISKMLKVSYFINTVFSSNHVSANCTAVHESTSNKTVLLLIEVAYL